MQLVEKHIIKKGHPFYTSLDDLCFKSKNLYNATLYAVRQHFFNTTKFISYYKLQPIFQNENQFDYRALPTNISQQVIRLVNQNFKSFFEALKSYQKNPEKFNAAPQLPKYLHKTKGRFVTVFTQRVIGKRILDNTGILCLTGIENVKIKTSLKLH